MLPKRYFCKALIEKVVILFCRQARDVPNSPHYADMIYVLPSRRERMKMMMEMQREGGRDENNNREGEAQGDVSQPLTGSIKSLPLRFG